jgi:hypothetical protein
MNGSLNINYSSGAPSVRAKYPTEEAESKIFLGFPQKASDNISVYSLVWRCVENGYKSSLSKFSNHLY